MTSKEGRLHTLGTCQTSQVGVCLETGMFVRMQGATAVGDGSPRVAFDAVGDISARSGAFDAVGDRNPVPGRAGCPPPERRAPGRVECPWPELRASDRAKCPRRGVEQVSAADKGHDRGEARPL